MNKFLLSVFISLSFFLHAFSQSERELAIAKEHEIESKFSKKEFVQYLNDFFELKTPTQVLFNKEPMSTKEISSFKVFLVSNHKDFMIQIDNFNENRFSPESERTTIEVIERNFLSLLKEFRDSQSLGLGKVSIELFPFSSEIEGALPIDLSQGKLTSSYTVSAANGPCVNMDFSNGTSGWSGSYGTTADYPLLTDSSCDAPLFGSSTVLADGTCRKCPLFGSCYNDSWTYTYVNINNPNSTAGFNSGAVNAGAASASPGVHTIMTGGFDPHVPGNALSVVPPGGGNSIRLGWGLSGNNAQALRQTFLVTDANKNFTYRYAAVLNDPPGHTQYELPYFQVKMYDGAGHEISCASIDVNTTNAVSLGGFVSATSPILSFDATIYYKNWTAVLIPLNNYIGQNVTIEFITSNCTLGGHFGYAYFQCECGPQEIIASSPAVCGGSTISLAAPAGLGSYNWSASGGGHIVGATNGAGVNIDQAGTYTVTMTTITTPPSAPCTFTMDTIIPGNPSRPFADFTATTVCAGSATQFTDVSAPTGQITHWDWDFNNDGVADDTSQNPSHVFPGPGTYPVNLYVTWPPCRQDTTINVAVYPSPKADFTATTVCQGVSTSFTNTTQLNGGTVPVYSWNFDDPLSGANNTSTSTNPTHTFTSSGTYSVYLLVTVQGGCYKDTIITVTVNALPMADFSATTACLGDVSLFTDGSSSNATSIAGWAWDFGDGQAATIQTPSNTYIAAGSHTVSLTVTNDLGCVDDTVKQIVVNDNPLANFGYTQPCEDTASVFTSTSTIPSGSITNYNWDFDNDNNFTDGSGSTINHLFGSDGIYSVGLEVISDNGCRDTLVINPVNVWPNPVALFSPTSVCAFAPTVFVDQSAVATGSVVSWSWDIDNDGVVDATTSTTSNTYTVGGIYSVGYTVITDHGCKDSASKNVSVNYLPDASFTSVNTCMYDSVPFTGTSIVTNANIVTSQWDFGDGQTSALANPEHLFSTCGNHVVTLVVTSDSGCVNTITDTATVYCLPQSAFVYSQPCEDTASIFTSISTISSGSITNFNWDFNNDTIYTDGSGGTLNNLYGADGVYTVGLEVISDNGCRDTNVVTGINVWPDPVAIFSPTSVCALAPTVFTDQSTVNVGVVVAWSWDFDNDSVVDATASTASHIYTVGGSYPINFTVTSDHGCVDSASKNVSVNFLPEASFVSVNSCLYDSVPFTGASAVTNANIASSLWDFGDGQTSALANPSHLFSVCGNQLVTLLVTSDSGCVGTVTDTVTVYCLPQSSFTYSQPCEDTATVFTSTSVVVPGIIISYNWDFNNDNIYADDNGNTVNYFYGADGSYTAGLEVISDKGCRDTIVLNGINVWPNPVADFSATSVCAQGTTDVSDQSNVSVGSITDWEWDFDADNNVDDTSSTSSHIFVDGGSYPVSLSVGSNHGCKHDTIKSVNVNYIPVPGYTFINACVYDSVSFFNTSTVVNAGIATSQWFFGDGQNVTATSPSHLYATCGDKGVILVVTSDSGCTNTANNNITVFCRPQASFTYTDVCEDSATIFISTSTVEDAVVSNFNWDFDNDSIFSDGTGSPATYAFINEGVYSVGVEVISDQGCKDTTVVNSINVWPNPVADFSSTSVCAGTNSSFSDLSAVSTGSIVGWSWDFDSNGTVDAGTAAPSYTYVDGGVYPVKFIAISDKGCSHDTVKNVNVNYLPLVNFSAANVCVYDSMVFINASGVAGAQIVDLLWDFGDGQMDTVNNPNHLYTTCGDKFVKLTATSDSLCTSDTTIGVTVYCEPQSDFDLTNVCEYNDAVFTSVSTVSDGSIVAYNWNTDTSSSSTYTIGADTLRNLYSDGTYGVGLIATSSYGCKDTIIKNVVIYPQPVAGFTFNTKVCLGNPTCFTDISSTDAPAVITNWFWNMDNAGTLDSLTQNPCTTFGAEGSHVVKLIVKTSESCYDTVTTSVFVNPIPVVSFMATDVCQGLVSLFTNNSQAGLANYTWAFGDGDSSSLTSPSHTYLSANAFNAVLVGQSDSGCINIATDSVFIYPNPVVDFSTPDIEGCEPWTSTFVNVSTVTDPVTSSSITSYSWDLGNGSDDQTTIVNPTDIVYEPGEYDVSLIVTTNHNCSDTLIRSNYVVVHPKPVADFSYLPEEDREATIINPHITFYDESSGADHIIWNMGDSTILNDLYAVGESFIHSYKDSGAYSVTQIVSTDYGCVDTIQKRVIIGPEWTFFIPNAFSPNDDGVNDHFNGMGVGIVEYKLEIYDRWGNLLDEVLSITSKGWDGKAKKGTEEAQVDTYIYKVYFTDVFSNQHTFVGTFSLIR